MDRRNPLLDYVVRTSLSPPLTACVGGQPTRPADRGTRHLIIIAWASNSAQHSRLKRRKPEETRDRKPRETRDRRFPLFHSPSQNSICTLPSCRTIRGLPPGCADKFLF